MCKQRMLCLSTLYLCWCIFYFFCRLLICIESNKCFGKQIEREREGEQIDHSLLKNVLDIFVSIGMGNMDSYVNDFEDFMLKDTASYYSRKAAIWIVEDSCPDYMLKVSHFY